MSTHVSVIIPMRDYDNNIVGILSHLNNKPNIIEEVIIVSDKKTYNKLLETNAISNIQIRIFSECIKLKNRSNALNIGVNKSSYSWLWFLHADSKINDIDLIKLEHQLASNTASCWYFNLKFFQPRPLLMLFTQIMVRLRCSVFALPFGDQGLLVQRQHFDKVNGFDDVSIAEDLRLVLKLKKAKVAIRSTKQTIYTSAEKYLKNNWLKTTCYHFKVVVQVVLCFYLVKTVKK